MSKLLFGKPLPNFYCSVPAFTEIAAQIQKAKVLFSGLFLHDGQEIYLLNKEKKVFIDTDWQAYSLIRATAKLMLSTGSILRVEPDVYLSRQSYGDKHVDELYRVFQQSQRQKVMIFSKLLNKTEVAKYIDPTVYQLVDTPKFSSLTELITQIKNENDPPIVVQFGMKLMKEYFAQVNNGGNNEIDTLLISTYRGYFQSQFKGLPMSIPLQQHYNLTWRSAQFPCKLFNHEQQGELVFTIYTKKT